MLLLALYPLTMIRLVNCFVFFFASLIDSCAQPFQADVIINILKINSNGIVDGLH